MAWSAKQNRTDPQVAALRIRPAAVVSAGHGCSVAKARGGSPSLERVNDVAHVQGFIRVWRTDGNGAQIDS